jgi:predicted ATPase
MTITTPTNLPASMTRFVGRDRELDEVGALIRSQRLVTLTGPGGSGKTRLGIETARTLMDEFPDGVWFVALDAVRDPKLVIPTIAQILDTREQAGREVSEVLAGRLADERTLLVLDNLEQVVEAARTSPSFFRQRCPW